MSDADETDSSSTDAPENPDDPTNPSSGVGGSTVLRTALNALRATLGPGARDEPPDDVETPPPSE